MGVEPGRVGAHEVEFLRRLRLLEETDHPARIVQAHDAHRRGFFGGDRHGGNGHVGAALLVRSDHLLEVHAVELIAGEDEDVVDAGLFQVAEVLPHGVGRALIPIRVVQGLLGGQQLDEAAAEGVERIRAADVPVEAHGVELRQHVDAVQAAVDAVGERDVDQPVLSGDRDRGLGAILGQWIEARPLAAAQHQRHDVLHARSLAGLRSSAATQSSRGASALLTLKKRSRGVSGLSATNK